MGEPLGTERHRRHAKGSWPEGCRAAMRRGACAGLGVGVHSANTYLEAASMYLRRLLGTMIMATAGLASAVEFHVAPRGSATGTGTKEFPFGTLEKARDAVAEAKRQGLGKEGIVVWVHGGRYQRSMPFALGSADGGTPGAPVVYRRAPGEHPVLSGAQALPLNAFFPVRDPSVLERLPVSARKSVRVANLKAYQINDYGTLPVKFRGAVPVLELFCDGERMELARWPNKPDWAVIARIVDRGSTSKAPTPRRPGVFKYADPRHERWLQAKDAYLNGYWCFDWFDECIKVGTIDPVEHTVTLAAPHGYGVGRAHTARRYYAFNLLEELDSPGEYYLDRDTGMLYFWPPKGADGPVYLSMLSAPAIQVSGASDLRFEGLTVEHVRGGAIEIRDAKRVQVAGCTVRHTGGYGISITGGESCRVDTCDVYDIGTGAILLQGGDPKTLTPCHHRATNNHIHHFARRQRTYAGGIALNGVGLQADHNLIHDAPHSAILAGANDCLIEYNEVHDVCLETDDCGLGKATCCATTSGTTSARRLGMATMRSTSTTGTWGRPSTATCSTSPGAIPAAAWGRSSPMAGTPTRSRTTCSSTATGPSATPTGPTSIGGTTSTPPRMPSCASGCWKTSTSPSHRIPSAIRTCATSSTAGNGPGSTWLATTWPFAARTS
jgi:hypothetical protein